MSILCFFGTFFHPIYSMVNATVLGHEEQTLSLAGLGLGSLTMGICSLSILFTFGTGSGVAIAQAFGSGELRMCAVYANR